MTDKPDRWGDATCIHPALRRKVEAVQSDMSDYGYTLFVTDGYRTLAEQARLYAQGRTLPGPKVTSIKRGMHNLGLAADVAFIDARGRVTWEPVNTGRVSAWALYGHMARVHGLIWGGDWKWQDLPHVQLIGVASQGRALALLGEGLTLPELWRVLEGEGRIPT